MQTTPPPRDTTAFGQERTVRILLECILVLDLIESVVSACKVKADVIFLLDCAVGLADDNFGIKQDLVFDMVRSLHVADTNVRIAYLPYNTEVFETFGFSHFRTKAQVIEQLGEIPFSHLII